MNKKDYFEKYEIRDGPYFKRCKACKNEFSSSKMWNENLCKKCVDLIKINIIHACWKEATKQLKEKKCN